MHLGVSKPTPTPDISSIHKRYMRPRALVGAYWRLARDLARAFGARYDQAKHILPLGSLTLRRYGASFGGHSTDDRGGGSAPPSPVTLPRIVIKA